MTWLVFLAALAAGAANPFQSGTNAELNKQMGHPVWAAVIVYASALGGLLLLQLFLQESLPTVSRVPWWAWLGGTISVLSTVTGLMFAQKLGSGLFTGLSLTASLVTSIVLDHFGLVGFRQHAASPGRIAGCALMVAGIWMISHF